MALNNQLNTEAKAVYFMTNGSSNLAGIKIIHNHIDQSDEDDEDEIQEGGNILFVGIFLLLLLLLYWFRRAYLKHNAKL